jgi:hypothetical protein
MRRLVVALTLSSSAAATAAIGDAGQDGAPAAAVERTPDVDRESLLAAARKLTAAEGYTYAYIPDVGARNEADPGAAANPAQGSKGALPRDEWRIAYTKRDFQHFRKGKAEFWRLGRRTVALGRADEWMLLESSARGEDGSPDESARGMERLAKEIDRIFPPHRFIVDLVRSAMTVTRQPAADGGPADAPAEYVVALAPANVAKLARGIAGTTAGAPTRPRRPADGEGGGSGGGRNPEHSDEGSTSPDEVGDTPSPPATTAGAERGEMRVTVGAEGIRRIEIELTAGSGAAARVGLRRYDLSAIGTTEPEPPDPAWDLLDPIEDEDATKSGRRKGRGKGKTRKGGDGSDD